MLLRENFENAVILQWWEKHSWIQWTKTTPQKILDKKIKKIKKNLTQNQRK